MQSSTSAYRMQSKQSINGHHCERYCERYCERERERETITVDCITEDSTEDITEDNFYFDLLFYLFIYLLETALLHWLHWERLYTVLKTVPERPERLYTVSLSHKIWTYPNMFRGSIFFEKYGPPGTYFTAKYVPPWIIWTPVNPWGVHIFFNKIWTPLHSLLSSSK